MAVVINGTTGIDKVQDGSIVSADLDTNIAVAGDLTVDTNTLKVDSTNNNVGIGTSSPTSSRKLHINDSSSWSSIRLTGAGGNFLDVKSYGNTSSGSIIDAGGDQPLRTFVNGVERLRIESDGRGLSQFTAKAWVNFNGTGTVAIRDSHNVSSVADLDVGYYRVNYSNNMANANYAPLFTSSYVGSSYNVTAAMISGSTTSKVDILAFIEGGSFQDVTTCSVVVFGD